MTSRKIMLLGEIGVGKSSIVQRLVLDRFEMTYKPTIGVDVYRYEVPASETRPALNLIVWDTDGDLSELIFRHVYMKSASAAMIVGDVMRPGTLESMARLAEGFRAELPGRHVTMLLNKMDLVSDPQTIDIPPALLSSGAPIAKTSAKTGDNIKTAFIEAADAIVRRGQ